MGDCCCKNTVPDVFTYAPSSATQSISIPYEYRYRTPKVNPDLVDQLVLEMLTVAASRVDT